MFGSACCCFAVKTYLSVRLCVTFTNVHGLEANKVSCRGISIEVKGHFTNQTLNTAGVLLYSEGYIPSLW